MALASSGPFRLARRDLDAGTQTQYGVGCKIKILLALTCRATRTAPPSYLRNKIRLNWWEGRVPYAEFANLAPSSPQ